MMGVARASRGAAVTAEATSCAGTDNKELVQSQYYVGCKHERVRGDAYYELLDEFITAAQRRCAGSKPTHTHFRHAASSLFHKGFLAPYTILGDVFKRQHLWDAADLATRSWYILRTWRTPIWTGC